jgi:predicted enzyme related to lactoylglutathione lyase
VPRVIHFEILGDDPERAVKFYRKAFGWKIKKWEGPVDYWLVTTGEDNQPGINGAIMEREGKGSVYNTIDVPSVDEFIKNIVEADGKVITEKRAVPGVGYMAYCADTEGNVFGIMQEDPSAH